MAETTTRSQLEVQDAPETASLKHIFEVIKSRKQRMGRIAHHLQGVMSALLVDEQHPVGHMNRWHGFKGLLQMEGFVRPEQADCFKAIIEANPNIKNVAEIGFNGGHSCFAFLKASDQVKVTSFDIGEHGYTAGAAEYISEYFPGRHQLIVGDSVDSVPNFSQEHPDSKFDLIFIDGGHQYETAAADIRSMQKLATPETIIIMDDLVPIANWGKGPTKAWNEAVRNNIVCQIGIQSADNHTWAIGRYILPQIPKK